MPAPGTHAAKILAFLESHPDQAFTQSEIVEATDVKRGSVGSTLVRLREAGRVNHRGTDWRINDYDRSLTDAIQQAGAVAADHETESFDVDERQEYGIDPPKSP